MIVHEKFDDSISQSPYDLALIRVNRSLTLFDENESGVVPICLPWHSMLTVEYILFTTLMVNRPDGQVKNRCRQHT